MKNKSHLCLAVTCYSCLSALSISPRRKRLVVACCLVVILYHRWSPLIGPLFIAAAFHAWSCRIDPLTVGGQRGPAVWDLTEQRTGSRLLASFNHASANSWWFNLIHPLIHKSIAPPPLFFFLRCVTTFCVSCVFATSLHVFSFSNNRGGGIKNSTRNGIISSLVQEGAIERGALS